MQTNFSLAQLADPRIKDAEEILRSCVHCGFCTATCPTFALTGDELDSPRGRIYLIKDMLEQGQPANPETALHVDRCLSCLSCMTTCPSGVHYMHLVDHARLFIEETHRRPVADRLLRGFLATVMPSPGRFRAALRLASLARPFAPLLTRFGATGKRLAAALRLAPKRVRSTRLRPGHVLERKDKPRARVALLTGCVQPVLRPEINEATVELLTKFGVEIVLPKGEGCCGSITHHLGRDAEGLAAARRNIDAWTAEIEARGLDAILVTASGCGTTIKDYGHMFRHEPAYAAKAARVSALAKDVTEFLESLELPPPATPSGLSVAYHAACSLQHGQRVLAAPKSLLSAAGFVVRDIADGHMCCGSAGTYNILEPDLSQALRDRKIAKISDASGDVVAVGNIGCLIQLSSGSVGPVLHTVELLNWAHGGKRPSGL
ncbi:glycolate oxidase subunit GlcF [Oryzibacter oryziterrae]|uniref:glycolate oxidase subunit GlcF n=1 Tax=Oryzibacter oryziterrae TaxID=2766474 RepID=UPI001F02CB19|nr:glycolate oxidase subunit GlcF [Oryzibacter oryziterrae]